MSVRVQKVAREIQHLVATYIQQDIPDPMPALASVTDVDVTGDLRKAVVYFRIIGPAEDAAVTEKSLELHRKPVQKRVSEEIPLKFTPVLEFRYGHAAEADDVDRLLSDLAKRKTPWS